MKLKNQNKLIVKQWVKVFFLIVLVAAIAISIWLIASSLSKTSTKKELYTYNYNSGLDYKVYLKKNSFFNSDYLGMNKQYISSLIDYISVDATYNFQSSKELDYTYTVDAKAIVKGSYQAGETRAVELWSKDYMISPAETKSATGDKIVINKKVNIDYNTYNKLMSDFREAFGLSIDAEVDLEFKITVNGKEAGKDGASFNESKTLSLSIPLLAQTIQIKPDYINNGKEVVYDNTVSEDAINMPKLIIGLVLLAVSVILLIKLWFSLIKLTKKSEYVIELNKILNEYADIIAESANLPDLVKYDVVNIKHFHDLVDIEEELRVPILYTEIIEDYESWFIITKDNTAYKFILKQSDLIKFQK